MGRTARRKKRTHKINDLDGEDDGKNHPKTFIIERGKVGNTLKQLVMDVRKIMEPHTATHLKATKKNVLKDFISVAGPMGVTHFIIISKSTEHVYLKIARLPRGPTITFRVPQFSLGKEVVTMSKRPPPVSSVHYLTPPVLVINNFPVDSKPSQLMTSMLQNMYPTLNVQTVKLSDLRRCVLYSYNKTSKLIDFRHYAIKVVPRGMSRGVRKITQSKLPDLSRYEDISEYVLGGGASESEAEEAEGEVTLGQDLPGRGNIKQHQSSVRLYEIGPRLTLQLLKIESGLFNGEVLHHELVHRTKEEIKELKKRILKQKRLKSSRRKTQEDNVRRKKEEIENKRKRERVRQGKMSSGEEDEDDDEKWYTQEVGVAPDPELLLSSKKSSIDKTSKKRRIIRDVATDEGKAAKRYPRSTQQSKNIVKQQRMGVKKVFKTGTVFRKKSQRTKY